MTTKTVTLPKIIEAWGAIPHFVSPHSEKPMWQQIDDNYQHGGGWRDFEGFEVTKQVDDTYTMQYPGDPPYIERDRLVIGDETLVLFDHSWVLWVLGDDYKVARID